VSDLTENVTVRHEALLRTVVYHAIVSPRREWLPGPQLRDRFSRKAQLSGLANENLCSSSRTVVRTGPCPRSHARQSLSQPGLAAVAEGVRVGG